MTTEVSTVIFKMNWRYILDNYLKEKLWGKSWIVYEYNSLVVKLQLEYINVKSKTITINCYAEYNGSKVYGLYSNDIKLPIQEAQFNEKVLDKRVYGLIHACIVAAEAELIRDTEVYNNAVQDDEYAQELWDNKAEEFLDEQEVTNEDIREAYKDVHAGKLWDNRDTKASTVFNTLRYTLLTPCYLMNAHMNGNEEQFDNFREYVIDWDTSIKSIEEAFKEYDLVDIEQESSESLDYL